ncbi:MAG: SOS response-associated peptidase [Thermomicrobiales bacterium]
MCGRYVIEDFQELSERLTNVPIDILFPLRPSWNASPSQTLPVLVESEDQQHWQLKGMSWGLVPRWTKPGERPKITPINARSETVAEKPMFRSLFKQRRCIVPANGFYEWQRVDQHSGSGKGSTKQPYYIHLKDDPMMFFAGLYDEAPGKDGKPFESYTIITTTANEKMAHLHDRMPVMIEPRDIEHWLSRSETESEPLEYLLKPAPDGAIDIYPVSTAVNSPRNNEPDLIDPLEEQPSLFTEDEEPSAG